MKKNKISKEWINRQRRDIYVKKSKQEGFRSRAVYKLKEINDTIKPFKRKAITKLIITGRSTFPNRRMNIKQPTNKIAK